MGHGVHTRKPDRGSAGSIVGWRLERLRVAGLGSDVAARVARDRNFDIHAVLELVDRGCPPELAVRIAAPLEDGAGEW